MAISYGTITITDLGSVTKVDVYYYVSTSATELSGGSWSTDAPAWSDNKYIWSKTVTTWEEGRTTESNPACITGAKGTTGQSGRSIQSIKEQYYLSTSSTSQAGGSWQDSMPTYVNGRYYWTHSIITWKEPNGSTTTETTTAVLAGALTSANSTAKSASDTATAANNTATAANNTANAANTTAGEAKSIAQEAQSTAGQALTTANNKNKTFYQDSQPTGGSYLDGDSWYDTNDDNKLYIYNGTSKKWVAQQFGNAAIADSSITNAKIANATIQSAKIISLEGAKIVANSITANQLATDAIKSNNYQASPNTSSPYSATGTFLDLSTGNIYTPNFGVDSVNGAAHINGQIIATSGQIGDSSTNYWQIGIYNDYNMNPSAAIIGNGTSYIQSGTWQISNNRINTQTYDGNNQITYMHYGSKYWDYGMQVPELDSTKSTYINGVSNNWLYIRRSPSNSIPSLETDWEYLFRVDKDGTVYENGVKLSEKYASIDGVSGAYLPRSGGTITGNLTVNGTLTATASKANALTHTLTINGQSWSGSANLTINTLGVAYGGTGKTTGKDAANYFLNSLDTGSSTPVDTDYYISQYVNGGTTTTTYHRRPMSALWLYVKSKLSAADIYVPKTGGTFTGAVHVEDEFYADSATLGNLIVNGNANFTNGLRATALNGGQAIYPVKGTQTSKTGNWTGNINVSALYDGLTIAYWLPYAPDGNASLNLTLNNGTTTGAINCYYSGTSRLTTHYGAGNTILLTYWSNANINGSSYTGWWAHSQYYSNDIVQQGINYAQFQADTGGIQNYSLFLRTANDKYASIVTSAGTGTKTKSTLAFDLSRLYLYYCNNTIAVDGYTSTWYVKTSYPLADMRYSFNITSNAGFVGKKPVYLVFNAIQTGNGYHTLADNWWVQDLPTSVDNKLYMYLGMAYDWYRMDLELNHPIYYFENGSIQTYYDGYFAGRLSSSQITTALGYTPYNATNPNGYTSNKGTVTSVAASGSDGISISGSPITTSGTIGIGLNLSTAINGLGEGASPATRNDYIIAQYAGGGTTTTTYHRRKLSNIFAALAAEDIPSLPWSKISSGNDDLKAIEALTGTSGFLKKTAANTWTLDTNTYLTGITSSQVTTALGYTPYNATNPNGYTTNTGTVTKVTAGSGLKINTNTSGGDITTTGTINHINSVTAQTTQGLYPIKIDAQGHISAYGSAVTSWALSNITGADDLKAIEALSGTSGFLKKTAANTWSLDTTSYVPTTRKVNGHALSSDVTVTKGDVGLGNVTNYQQITGIGQGANGSLRVWTGDPTSTSTDDYTDIPITITAYEQSTVKKAVALDLNAAVGSTSKPVYFKADGKPYEIGYTIEKSVPSNAIFTDTTYTFDGTYNASTNKAATVSTVTNAINALDGGTIGTGGKGKTITSLSQSNGNVSATFADISITKSQISDFPTSLAPTSHTHGNIQNGGTLQTNDITIASGDKLVVTDSSDSSKIARSSVSFDGSTKTQALTKAGTWETFNNYSLPLAANGTRGGIQIGFTTNTTARNYAVQLSNEKAYVNVNSFPEAYLSWGGGSFSSSYGCIDAAMIPELGANRFAFLKSTGIEIDYSTDDGTTWNDYAETDDNKTALFARGRAFYLGKATTKTDNKINNQLRVTITTNLASVYTTLNKIAIYMSTNGNNTYVKIEKATKGDPTAYVTHSIAGADSEGWIGIGGWSGWNILNISGITTYGNRDDQYQKIRFIFKQTSVNSNYQSPCISRIMGFGGVGWTIPSNMAYDGHLYSYDSVQNATFPAKVTATEFIGNIAWSKVTNTPTTLSGYGITDSVLKWQKTSIASTSIYDFGAYVAQGADGAEGPGSSGRYYAILNIPYRKASGNTKPDYSWCISGSTDNDSRLFYRTSNETSWGSWQEIVHISKNTGVGNSTQPVYVSSTGVVTACTSYANASVNHATSADSATKATQDSDGNQINTTYLKLAGGTMTGVLNAKANQYEDAFAGALNMNNSNIYGVNSIYTADASDNSQEGIHFFRDTTHVDTIHAQSGVLYFTPNRPIGSTGTSYSIYHTGNKPTKSDVGLGNVDNTADANKVVKGVSAIAGYADTYRHVWFSDSNPETSRNYDDDFKYNPSKNNLQVKNITGDSIQLTNWKVEEDSSTNSLMFRYVG